MHLGRVYGGFWEGLGRVLGRFWDGLGASWALLGEGCSMAFLAITSNVILFDILLLTCEIGLSNKLVLGFVEIARLCQLVRSTC